MESTAFVPVLVNTRVLSSSLTGVQRYTSEIVNRLGSKIERIAPKFAPNGIAGHAWEQFILPTQLRGRLLWSPSNTGPLAVERQVVTIHDLVPLDHPEWLNPQFASWYRFLVPRLARRVRKVVTISEFTRERILEVTKIEPQRVVVIPIGVDARFCPRPQEEIQRARQALGIPTPYYALSLGSLEPRKNLHRLLQAWEQLQGVLPEDVWLVVAGASGKRLVFREVSFERLPPRVHLTGHVPDELLPALYAGALTFAYLSVYEGFGLPPLEAMACGTPMLVSNVTSLPEVVGDAGLLVDPHDIEAIAYGIRRIVEDSALRERLRRKGLERARLFTWERTAEQTWRVLQEAAASG